MTAARHVFEAYIRATPEAIWSALTDPAFTRRYFHGTAVDSAFEPGSGYRYVTDDGTDALVGEIEQVEPGRRLVMTFRMVYDTALAEEPPSRVEWLITPAGAVTRVTLRHGDLALSPLTWERTRLGWLQVLDGMKTLLETGTELGPVADPADQPRDPEALAAIADEVAGGWHRAQAVEANNAVWRWLGLPAEQRTEDDDEAMTRSAYAAAHHWSKAAGRGPANEARAEWLLSRVWVARGQGELALHHSRRCMGVCRAAELEDFDLAYAHEALARALACLGRDDEARYELAAAHEIPIADPEDRELVESDLAAGPWFGLTAAG
jgi:uncharacterized protein YndB with AHSA1/START domain